MADIVVKGKPFFRVDPTLAKILEQLFPEDIQQRRSAPPIQKSEPKWFVGVHLFNGRALLKLTNAVGTEYVYQGPPEQAQATFTKAGFPVPQEFLDRYASAYVKPNDYTPSTPELNQLAGHYRRDQLACTPTPERKPQP